MLVQLTNIGKSYGSYRILRDVSFQLNEGEKIGLVGKNGSGKTTLIRIIYGGLEQDEGEVLRHSQIRIGVMHQMVHIDAHRSLLEEALSVFKSLEDLALEMERLESSIAGHPRAEGLQSLLDQYGQLQTRWEMEGGYSFKAKTESVLFGLGFEKGDLDKSTVDLSGGELNRLNLAKLLLSQPSLLLLDEPTNHLDIPSVKWLEEFLHDYGRAFMVISHDRYFLDHTVEKILELSNGKGELYTGNYSRFIGEREKRRQMRQKEYEEQQELIARTQEFIRRNIAGQNTRQAQSRQKMLDRLERLEKVQTGGASARFRFDLKTQSGNLVLETRNLAVGYDGIVLAGLLNLKVYRGERVGIIGPNGSGKTTLLRTLLSELPPVRGEYEFGFKVDLAFYAQQLTLLNPELTVLEEMREITPLSTEEELRSYLARFLFRGEEVFKAVGTLSGGEKSRLALARLIFGKANTLILDEPTNHLDIPSREALEDALLSFPGTLFMVSHDRYLINKLAQRIVYIDGEGNVTVHEGNYDEFEAQRAASPARESQPVRPMEPPRIPEFAADSSPRRLSKNERNKTLQRCSLLENEIEALEEELHSITAALNDPAYSSDYQRLQELGNQFETSTSRRNQLYAEWEQLQTTLTEE